MTSLRAKLYYHHSLLRHVRQHESKKYKRQVHNKTHKNRELQNRRQENIIISPLLQNRSIIIIIIITWFI